MALNPEDPGNGFRHYKVLTFINEQMARHSKGPEFYLENLSLSWEEVEDKLKVILEDSTLPSEAQKACAWGSLALGVRFACRQGLLQGRRVQWLHDFANLHKSAAQALASDLKKLTEQQEIERKEAACQLRLAQTKLAEVQKERDLMREKLLRAELKAASEAKKSAMASTSATAGWTETQGAGEKEEVKDTGKKGREKDHGVASMAAALSCSTVETVTTVELAATVETGGNVMQSFEWKNYPIGFQKEGECRSLETSMCSFSGPLNPTSSPEPITVQLPDSFTYSYESPYPVARSPSPPPSKVSEPQMPSYFMASEMNLLSDMGASQVYLQEPQQDRRDFGPQQQKKVFRRAGDWECPWCKTVNFSQRENCFHCGKSVWPPSHP